MPLIVDTGTYTGDGVNNRVISFNRFSDLGLSPTSAAGWVCFIIRTGPSAASGQNAFKTSAHDDTVDNSLRDMSTLFQVTGSIHKVTSAGIEVGTDTAVNTLNDPVNTYHWFVIADGMGETADTMVVGTYTGTAASNAISGVGFAPDAVITFVVDITTNHSLACKFQSVGTGNDLTWTTLSDAPDDVDHIKTLDSDGFTLGATTSNSNNNNVDYGFIAFKRAGSSCEQDTYSGDDADDRDIVHPTHTFQPQIVWLLNDVITTETVHRTDTYSGDASQIVKDQGQGGANEDTNWIQGFNTDGFEVGTEANVSTSSRAYHYLSLKDNFAAGAAFGGTPPSYTPFVRSPFRSGYLSKYQQYKSETDLAESLRSVKVL